MVTVRWRLHDVGYFATLMGLQMGPSDAPLHWIAYVSPRYTDVDVVELRAQADASMPASNNNVNSHYIL